MARFSNLDSISGPSPDAIDDADVIMSDNEGASDFAPPPHLAARFYRSANNRRKTSGASSRRSSISSLHSHPSNHSGRSRHQNTLAAHHLRRASMIEDRKQRLAERAAHAEQVRLRAALAKAAPRASNSEERALAAQHTRERLLAEITSKCEEEVRRAKKVAEDMKERKAAEHVKLKEEMEKRYADAEKRRQLYQKNARRPRTQSLPVVEEKKVVTATLNQEGAARLIQKAWRMRLDRLVVKRFLELDFSIDRIREMSFEKAGALISEEKVLVGTIKMLKLCGLEDAEHDRLGKQVAARNFLSAFTILGHPAEILSGNEEQDKDLLVKAKDLIVAFNDVVPQLPAPRGTSALYSQMASLSEAYASFTSALRDWKAQEKDNLVKTFLDDFIELQKLWDKVKDSTEGGVAAQYREGIQLNQTHHVARIHRLVGREKGMNLIRDALRELRKEQKRGMKAKPKDSVPRGASIAESVTGEPAASPEQSRESDAEVSARLPPTPRGDRDHLHAALGRVMTSLPENRVIIHELAINKEFKIEQQAYTEIRRSQMEQTYSMMRKSVREGHTTEWTIVMGNLVREKLLHLLPPGTSLHTLISESLDAKLMENQCRAGAFSYESFFSFMGTILPKICSPARDGDVKAFAEDKSDDFIDRLARLMSLIDLLYLDHSNHLLTISARSLIKEAPGYEQQAFARDLEAGKHTLDQTYTSWRAARATVLDELAKRDPENVNGPPKAKPPRIYIQSLVDLAISNAPFPAKIPETLHLDRTRLQALRTKTFTLAALGAILLTAKNLLKRDSRSPWKPEAERLLSTPSAELDAARVLSVIESTHPLPPATKSQLTSTIKRNLEQADSQRFTDPVPKLLFNRLKAHVLARLAATSAQDRVRLASGAGQSLASAGLVEFVGVVAGVVEELGVVAEVDMKAHGGWYDQISEVVEKEEAEKAEAAAAAAAATGRSRAPTAGA